jgi:uncharacterized membrane protein YdjX (TVP38/TMEM64 family)
MGLLALGVSIRWAQPGPADFTPVVAMLAGVLVARFVIGLRLTVVTTVAAAAAGAGWAAAVATWGFSVPTLVLIAAVAVLRAVKDHRETA